MAWWNRRKPAPRQATAEDLGLQLANMTEHPPNTFSTGDSADILRGIFNVAPRVAGVDVNPQSAMRVSAVYACVRLIAGAIAAMPLPVYQRTVVNGERLRQRVEHPTWTLLNEEFAPAWTAQAGWEYLVGSMLLRGDGFAPILRDRAGRPVAFLPVPKECVRVVPDEAPARGRAPRLQYAVQLGDQQWGIDQDDMLHMPGFGFDGCNGMSFIQWGGRTATGIAIAADEHAGDFYAHGTKADHAVAFPKKLTEDQLEVFLAAWRARHNAGRGTNGLPIITTEGASVQQLTLTARDAQVLESRQWQVIEIARAAGVPPHLIGETTKATSWGSGIQEMGIGFVTYTLMPHLRRMRTEINRKLFRGTDFFAEHNPAALLQADNKGKADYYKAALGGTQNPAWLTQNEVRGFENLPPVDGGDTLARPEANDAPDAQDLPADR